MHCLIRCWLLCRIPGHLYDLRYKIRTATDELARQWGVAPSDEDVAAYMKLPVAKVVSIKHVRPPWRSTAILLGCAGAYAGH